MRASEPSSYLRIIASKTCRFPYDVFLHFENRGNKIIYIKCLFGVEPPISLDHEYFSRFFAAWQKPELTVILIFNTFHNTLFTISARVWTSSDRQKILVEL